MPFPSLPVSPKIFSAPFPESHQEKKIKFFLLFLGRFLGRVLVFFLFFLFSFKNSHHKKGRYNGYLLFCLLVAFLLFATPLAPPTIKDTTTNRKILAAMLLCVLLIMAAVLRRMPPTTVCFNRRLERPRSSARARNFADFPILMRLVCALIVTFNGYIFG